MTSTEGAGSGGASPSSETSVSSGGTAGAGGIRSSSSMRVEGGAMLGTTRGSGPADPSGTLSREEVGSASLSFEPLLAPFAWYARSSPVCSLRTSTSAPSLRSCFTSC